MQYDEEDLQQGVLDLVAAMLQLAVQDFKRGPERKDDVEAFLESEGLLVVKLGFLL